MNEWAKVKFFSGVKGILAHHNQSANHPIKLLMEVGFS